MNKKLKECFIDYIMNPVKHVDDEETLEKCEPDDPDIVFWSVYGVNKEGYADCIADFIYEEHARLFHKVMLCTVIKKEETDEDTYSGSIRNRH